MADQIPVLSDYTDPQLAEIQRHQMLAQALMQSGGNGSAVGSPWEALNRAVSPLLGALAQKSATNQFGEISAAASPELAKIAQSDNPVALAAASQNPLVRAMLPDLVRMQISQGYDVRGAGAKEAALGQAKLGYEPQLTMADAVAKYAPQLEYGPKIAGATAAAENPALIGRAVSIAKQTLPFEEAKSAAAAKAAIDAQMGAFNGMFGAGGVSGSFPGTAPSTPTVTSKSEFDALPSGTIYTEADGNTYRKP